MDEKIRNLIGTLTDKTSTSKIKWERTSRDNEFICKTGSGAITVDSYMAGHEFSDEEEHVVDICILNDQGIQIERIYYDENSPSEFRLLLSLHQSIYRKYHKIDEVIDNIISEISEL
ncbi:MAG TPA: hypothetical protein VFF22_19945 [Pseudomonas sp.]|nr:hypothetical protein [Pseudomonas sp.]